MPVAAVLPLASLLPAFIPPARGAPRPQRGTELVARPRARPCGATPLLFLHIPRTGGTSVEEVFRAQGCPVGRLGVRYATQEETKCTSKSWWHTPPLHTKVDLSRFVSFTVVRDPIDRFISVLNWGWNWTRHWRQGVDGKHFDFRDGVDAFVRFYLSDTRRLIFDGDCHLLPQSLYLRDTFGRRVHHVLHTASLADELPYLAARLGARALPPTPAPTNAAGAPRARRPTRHFATKNSTKRRAQRFTASDLSAQSLAAVRAYYAEDFRALRRLQRPRAAAPHIALA